MNNAIIPLFCTERFDDTKSFYMRHLGFRVSAEMPGYAELEQGEGGPRLGFMAPDEECEKWTAASGNGLIYCFQVEDADAEHTRLAGEGVSILEAPADKPWGERGFLAQDPNGIALYFGHPIESPTEAQPSVETAAAVQ